MTRPLDSCPRWRSVFAAKGVDRWYPAQARRAGLTQTLAYDTLTRPALHMRAGASRAAAVDLAAEYAQHEIADLATAARQLLATKIREGFTKLGNFS